MRIPFYGLRNEAEAEAYSYFHHNIRPLPQDSSGKTDIYSGKLWNNDADAFRHAYVSGVFTQEYGKRIAEVFGSLNEFSAVEKPKDEENMDLWNNNVGRKYGLCTSSRKELLDLIRQALQDGELIITPHDSRKYQGSYHKIDPQKPVVTCKETKTGGNESFLDLQTFELMSREEFCGKIESGLYPGYTTAHLDALVIAVSKPDGILKNNLG